MGKLYLYAIFHANLSFSSIPSDQYSKIVDKCYWPVLDLVSSGYKLGLEFSSSTLRAISLIDKSFIDQLAYLWDQGKCDVIGSGLIQNIFPLIPAEVNRVNFLQGRFDYERMLGNVPEIVFVNEQTYSAGIPSAVAKAGYKAFVMDWDNADEFNDYPPDLRYQPAMVKGVGGARVPVIWNSSLNSYKFQRCIYNRLSSDDFTASVVSHFHPDNDRALLLYGTDWEIFDYRPAIQQEVSGEVAKIEKILAKLAAYEECELVNPTEILEKLPPKQDITIETPESPLPCKNRDDYNVVRWAVSGRDNVNLNTECYKIFHRLKSLEFFNGLAGNNNTHWCDVNELWGSDLRTKTTDEKYYSGRAKTGEVSRLLEDKLQNVYTHFQPKHDFILVNQFPEDWQYEPYVLDVTFQPNDKRGSLSVEIDGAPVPTQCEMVELYRDGSIRRAKLVICPYIKSGYAVEGKIVQSGELKQHVYRRYGGNNLKIRTDSVQLGLSCSTGADIRELRFPQICDQPLIGYLPPVYYDHIGHSSDYYSGGIQLCDSFGKTYNDTVPTVIYLPQQSEDFPIRIPITCELRFGHGICWKNYYVYRDIPRVDLSYRFYFQDIMPIYWRLGIVTCNPEAFLRETLRFTTTNGSDEPESFFTAGKRVGHHDSVESLASARTCLGATEGWIDVSDACKGLTIATDKSALYSVPMVEYEEIKKTYLMRIYHSISESDETGRIHWRGHTAIPFSFFGHGGDLQPVRNMVNHSIRSLICIPSDGRIKSRENHEIYHDARMRERVAHFDYATFRL
ncbi:MAG: hypothetical protein RBU23_09280 [Candidatus Auribacterota bacterium]|nr:hypothetical protein [Candidatus Auribacterota bacterium]